MLHNDKERSNNITLLLNVIENMNRDRSSSAAYLTEELLILTIIKLNWIIKSTHEYWIISTFTL